jgi:hypothetical protein
MIARCHNPKSTAYAWYGARGITVCDRWRGEHGFENFIADMGNPPPKHHIDRIDTNGNYEPGNCRWTTCRVNQNNRRKNVRLTWDGQTKTLAEWAEITGIKYGTLWTRVRLKWETGRVLGFAP